MYGYPPTHTGNWSQLSRLARGRDPASHALRAHAPAFNSPDASQAVEMLRVSLRSPRRGIEPRFRR